MATIKDVAKKAGVSIATVSYVMNNDPRIKKETAAKVLKVAEEIKYLPSGIARNFKKSKTDNILVLIHNFGGPIYQEILEEIHTTLKELNYKMIVCSGELARKLLQERTADGAIVLDTTVETDLLEKVAKKGFPIIDLRKVYEPNSPIIIKTLDGFTPVYEVIKLAIHSGYQKFGFMHGNTDSPDNIKRYNGYNEALKEHGLVSSCELSGQFREHLGYQTFKDFVETGAALPEVLFCANDEMAIGVINYCNETGIRIPEQMKIIGFDNIAIGKYIRPQLTSIDINRAEWAKNLAQSIVLAIEDRCSEIKKYDASFAIIRRETF
jgi:LacI family transcriptional regulator